MDIDYEKALDSVDRETLWKPPGHDGVPIKVIMTQHACQGMPCRVVRGGQLSDHFKVKTGVLQGWLLTPFLFPRETC